MRKILVACILILGFAGQALAAEKFINFVNKTDTQIKKIFLAPAGTKDASDNLLKKWKLKPGKAVKIAVPHDRLNCKWDLQYVGRQDKAFTIRDIDICKAVEIELYLEGDTAWANVK